MKLKSLFAIAAAFHVLPVMAESKLSEALADVTVSGHIDVSYDYANTEGGAAPTQAASFFQSEDNGVVLHQAYARFAKAPAKGAGGAVSVLFGSDAEALSKLSSADMGADDFFLPEAYLSYTHGATTVYAGRLSTLTGAEVIPTPANINATRGVIFNYQPFYHTGVRVSHKLSDSISITGGVMNSNLLRTNDDNEGKTLELSGSYSAGKFGTVLSMYVGDEAREGNSGNQIVIDNVINYAFNDKLNMVLNTDYFNSKLAAGSENGFGVSAMANYKLSPKCRVAGRVEHVEPADGSDNRLNSFTATYGHAVANNLELISELRYDMSKNDGFFPTGSSGDSQVLGTIKAVYKF